MSVMVVPEAMLALQLAPHEIAAGELVTVPPPDPALAVVRV